MVRLQGNSAAPDEVGRYANLDNWERRIKHAYEERGSASTHAMRRHLAMPSVTYNFGVSQALREH